MNISCKKITILFLTTFLVFILIKKFRRNETFQEIPTSTNLNYIAFTNSTGDIQAVDKNAIFTRGMIMAWSGSLTSLPNGWALCNGKNGTPDLRGRFILSYNDKDVYCTIIFKCLKDVYLYCLIMFVLKHRPTYCAHTLYQPMVSLLPLYGSPLA